MISRLTKSFFAPASKETTFYFIILNMQKFLSLPNLCIEQLCEEPQVAVQIIFAKDDKNQLKTSSAIDWKWRPSSFSLADQRCKSKPPFSSVINHGVSQQTKPSLSALSETQKAVFLPALCEGHLAVLLESDGSQPETKVRLAAGIHHVQGFRTGWPAAGQPAAAGTQLPAAELRQLRSVLQPLHGGLQLQHRLPGRLQGGPGVFRALPGPAVLLQVHRHCWEVVAAMNL